MRVLGTFYGPSSSRPDSSLLISLNQLLPVDERNPEHFDLLRTPRLEMIENAIKIAETNGWRQSNPRQPAASNTHEFNVWYEREYDASDYAAAECLRFAIGPMIESPGRDAEGRVEIDMLRSTLDSHELISGGENGCDMLVAEPIKRSLEQAALRGIAFRETAFVRVRDPKKLRLPWDYWKQPWWEIIGGELVLPPLSPRQTIQNLFTREAVPRGYEPPCLPIDVDDPRIGNPELHYDRSDLRVVEPFDWAKTHEKIGFDRNIIVSQRFYQAVKAGGDIGRWIPVRIHD